MKIIFAGTPANAAKTLAALVAAKLDVVGVLTRTDAPVGRKKVITPSPVAKMANELKIPIHKTNSLDTEAKNWLSSLKPDLGVIVAYGAILKSDTLAIPKFGWVNLHYSLLPKYPGPAPVQHAILGGETITGVTVFCLDEGIDSGPILSAKEMAVSPEDSSGELLEKLTEIGSELLLDTISNFELFYADRRPQLECGKFETAKKFSRSDAKLSFDSLSSELFNRIRSMNPEPMAWFEFEGNPIRVLRSSRRPANSNTSGEASIVDNELVVSLSDGALALVVVQPAGKEPMAGADWFRGLRRQSINLL